MAAPQRHCSGMAVEGSAALCLQTGGFPQALLLSDGIWVEGPGDQWLNSLQVFITTKQQQAIFTVLC